MTTKVETPPTARMLTARQRPAARVRRRRELRDGLFFVAPFLLVYALFLVVPVLQAVRISAYNWDLLGSARKFVGLANYRRMLGGQGIIWSVGQAWALRLVILAVTVFLTYRVIKRGAQRSSVVSLLVGGLAAAAVLGVHPSANGSWNDPDFWTSLKNTMTFTLVSTPLLMVIGLGFALALNTRRRAGGLYRAFFFLPYVLPISAVTLIWTFLLDPDRGLIGGWLHGLGLSSVAFLSDPHLAMPSIIATTIWWSVGFNLVLFLAGLQDIDPSLLEAASLDGANAWQRFRYVTLPGLRHVTILVSVTQLIASFQIFGQVYIMTKGGPGTATEVLIQRVYESGFRDYQLGYAATVSVFIFIVMSAVSAFQFRVIAKEA